jgi:hypothetical protein
MYEPIILKIIQNLEGTILLSGPSKIGITSMCERLTSHLTSWVSHRQQSQFRKKLPDYCRQKKISLVPMSGQKAILALDGILLAKDWDTLVFAAKASHLRNVALILTGHRTVQHELMQIAKDQERNGVFKYLPFRIHPWSVGECVRSGIQAALINPPSPLSNHDWEALLAYGGFPEPFSARRSSYSTRWRRNCQEELVRHFNQLDRVQSDAALISLMDHLRQSSGKDLDYKAQAVAAGVALGTIRRWVQVFLDLHFGFVLTPWTQYVTRPQLKRMRWFLRDWSGIDDPKARAKNMVACHLLKAVDYWTDVGFGKFALHTVRDQRGSGVDFLVSKNGTPWFLVNVVRNAQELPKGLESFRHQIGAEKAFQVVMNLPYASKDCFAADNAPSILVPAKTFLSQLP